MLHLQMSGYTTVTHLVEEIVIEQNTRADSSKSLRDIQARVMRFRCRSGLGERACVVSTADFRWNSCGTAGVRSRRTPVDKEVLAKGWMDRGQGCTRRRQSALSMGITGFRYEHTVADVSLSERVISDACMFA